MTSKATAPGQASSSTGGSKDQGEVLRNLEQPKVQYKVIALVLVALAFLWVLAAGLTPYVGPWGLVGMGVISAVVIGFGVYALRMAKKSRDLVKLLQSAADGEGRKAALTKLAGAKDSDAMAKLAQAQLLSQDDPQEAMNILEAVDLTKAPGVLQDDVRANLGLLYLMHGRARDARGLADEIKIDRQPQAKARALYAAVVAEAFARTGKGSEAKKLLETFDARDPEFQEVSSLLLRAQAFTYMATKNRGLARKAMEQLAMVDPNLLGSFATKGVKRELTQMAQQVARGVGAVPKQKMKMVRR